MGNIRLSSWYTTRRLMFEAECPSCSASYQVDERRVPATGLKMRCPKCGESFQVTAPGQTLPPVLGAALGLSAEEKKASIRPPRHKATMLGVPEQASPAGAPPQAAPPRAGVPRADKKHTMLGLAPAGEGLELAALDEDALEAAPDEAELDLSAAGDSDADLPAPSHRNPAGQIDLPSIPPSGGSQDTGELDLDAGLPDLPTIGDDELDLPSVGGAVDLPSPARADLDAGLPAPVGEIGLPAPQEAELPSPAADLPDLGADLPELGADLPELGAGLPELEAGLPTVGGHLPVPAGNLPAPAGNLPAPAGNLPMPSGGNLPTQPGELPSLLTELPLPSGEDTSGDSGAATWRTGSFR